MIAAVIAVIAVIVLIVAALGAAAVGFVVIYSNSMDDTHPTPSVAPSPTITYVPSPVISKKPSPSPSPTPSITRPRTGTYIVDNTRSLGASEVTVKNGLNDDAVVVLVKVYDTSYTVSAVYVRAHDAYTIDVDRTLYYVYYTTGQDWDSVNKEFTRYESFERFDDEFDFHNYYWEITINPVVNGNAETSYVPPGDFPSL